MLTLAMISASEWDSELKFRFDEKSGLLLVVTFSGSAVSQEICALV